uniref:Interferon regulatory factor 1 n=1 Tax=Equus caballus TaxID=9796 RepID=A0A9L0S726_HORSE
MQHLLPKWGMVLYRHHLSLSLDQQGQDVRPSRAEQRPAGAVPSPDQRAQQPRDPGILCLLPAPTRNRAPRAGTAAPAAPGPSGAAAGSRRCRGEPPSLRWGPVASNKGAPGTRKWGPKTPAGRVSGARRCLGPRAGSGGRWRSGERQRGEGGPRLGPPSRPRLLASGRCRRSVCAKPPGVSGWLANMPITRMRMRPWLEMQINSNQIPGLIWINKEEMIFQIPWKHAAKHGWDINKDACLFRSWAIHTGRYKAGEKEPDPKTWKANFRCAMNSLPDIEEVKDQSRNKGSSAVRVYRMLPPLTKNQRKERKSKSSRDAKSKAKRKSCGDSSPDTFSDGLSSSTLPDDHSSYTAQSYMGQDLEIERALTPVLSSCAVSSTLPDWHMPGEIVPDSTSDLYSFQVSPMPSTSEAATDEDEEGKLTDDIMKFLEQSGWQPTNVDGKGYLLNEPGAQPPSVYGDFSCKEETEVDSHGGYIGLISSDLKNMDTSWLDSLLTPVRLPSIQAIPCAP